MNITIEKMVPHAVMLNVVNKNGIKLKVVIAIRAKDYE